MPPVSDAQWLTYLKRSRHQLRLLVNWNVPRIKDGTKRIPVRSSAFPARNTRPCVNRPAVPLISRRARPAPVPLHAKPASPLPTPEVCEFEHIISPKKSA